MIEYDKVHINWLHGCFSKKQIYICWDIHNMLMQESPSGLALSFHLLGFTCSSSVHLHFPMFCPGWVEWMMQKPQTHRFFQGTVNDQWSGQTKIFHQPRFPWNKGMGPFLSYHLGAQVVWGRYNLTRMIIMHQWFEATLGCEKRSNSKKCR